MEATRKAAGRFWRTGFGGTSVADLVEATGLNRFGLYGELGGKKGLFLKACAVYSEGSRQRLLGPLASARDPEQGLRELFSAVIDGQLDGRQPRGCLMANTLSDAAIADREIQAAVRAHFDTLEAALGAALRRAAGSQGSATTARNGGRLLVNTLLGLVQMACLNPNRSALRAIASSGIEAALRAARSKPPETRTKTAASPVSASAAPRPPRRSRSS